MKHTKGPWTKVAETIKAFPPGSDFKDPHTIAVVRKSVYLPEKSPKIKEWEANAQLIASAPELFVACNGALSALLLGPHVDKQQAIDYLREVIAKAEGRSE